MSKSSQLSVIVFISTIQLALTLLAVAWLFGWIRHETSELALNQVSDTNQFIAHQIAERVESMQLESLDCDEDAWQKLQDYICSVALPGGGFLSVIDAKTGEILCHPKIELDSGIRGQTWDNLVVSPVDQPLVDYLNGTRLRRDSRALLKTDESVQLVHGNMISGLDAYILIHQRISGVHAINGIFISSLQNFSFTIALIIGLSGTVLNVFMVKRIIDQDQVTQRQLEGKVEERTDELVKIKNAIIFGLAKLAESRDNDTGEHLDRIRKYVTILASDLKNTYTEIDDEFIFNLGIASSLHDIGKVGIPDAILLKPGRLTTLERSVMQRHTIIGGECLEAIGSKLGDNDFLEMAREVAFWHHEQWDGEGYPHQLSDDEIPISARIVAVADVYDALTSRRPYKKGMSHTESRTIIVSESGTKFDPEVVASFLRHEAEFQKIARRYQNVGAAQSTLETSTGELKKDTEFPQFIPVLNNPPIADTNSSV